MLLAVIAAAPAAALAVSCSGGSGSHDAGPTVFSCQDIRICALDYADDAMVMTNCVSKGSASAQTAFQMLNDCTKNTGGCVPANDINCLCMAQCLQDPPCVDLVYACTGNITDTICDNTCH